MGPRGGATSYRDQNHRSTNSNYRSNNNNNQEQQEIDNWDPASTQVVTNDNGKGDETWGDCGDWDNEEYTGSLSDTKVFTPSSGPQTSGQDLAAPPGLEQQILNPPSQNDVAQQYSATVVSGTATAGALNNGGGQYGEMHSGTTAAAQLRQALEMPQALSAEQSQYFNTLGSQNTGSTYSSSVQYPFNDQVGANQQAPRQQQQQQQRPRARVPPPSKIPSSAVEMPGDGLNVNVYLGVQFGELDFGTGTEESYETEKYAPGMDPSAGDDYSNKGTGVSKGSQSGGLGGLQPSITDSISSGQADLSSGYAQRNPNVSSSMGTAGGQSALDQLTKPADIYNSGTTAGGNAYQNLSYSATQKSGGYQTGGYGANAYNNSQTSNNYPPSSSNYGYNQNSYQSQGTQSGTGQQQTQTTGTGSSVSSGTANQPVNNSSSG